MPRSTRNKHQEKSEATQARLFKAALRVFSRDGFEAARIEDIAAEAGHTRGAFYAHFQSKEDLFFALLEDESRKHHEKARQVLERCSTNEARLRALREYYVARGGDKDWTVLILEFKLYALRHPRARAQLARAYRSIREKVKWEGLEGIWPEKLRRPPESRHLQKLILQAALSGLVLERAYDPSSISAAELSASLRGLFDFALS
ncbi:MAG TPA: helix-turn-helix domain-containing protein [Bryobacteraceae bacterium]|jgi:AcrR family transcriptional regulator